MPPPLESGRGKEDTESQEAESGSSKSRKNSAGRRTGKFDRTDVVGSVFGRCEW